MPAEPENSVRADLKIPVRAELKIPVRAELVEASSDPENSVRAELVEACIERFKRPFASPVAARDFDKLSPNGIFGFPAGLFDKLSPNGAFGFRPGHFDRLSPSGVGLDSTWKAPQTIELMRCAPTPV